MKTNNILTIGLLITLGISLYNLNSINNLKGETEETDSNKTFIPPAPPIIQKDLNSAQKNMMNNPLTPQMNNNSGPTTLMAFNEDVHDFGTVDIETENKYSFIFTNQGKEPLKISNAKGSCGCTVPNWPRDPIMPGQSSKIDVVYRPNKGQAGKAQNKTVSVTANTEPAITVLNIKALVNPISE
jgi:hypothetical protein